MKNERILSYKMSSKLSKEDLESVSAAGMTSTLTGHGSYNSQTGWDTTVDGTLDL